MWLVRLVCCLSLGCAFDSSIEGLDPPLVGGPGDGSGEPGDVTDPGDGTTDVDPPPPIVVGPTPGGTITITARIDGRSRLRLKRDTVLWRHLEFAAPGRHGGDFPTVINGVDWFPVWPDIPNAGNVDCNCSSSTLTGVTPPIPTDGRVPTLQVNQARDEAEIVLLPDASNDYTLIIEFDDDPSGSADYKVEVIIPDP